MNGNGHGKGKEKGYRKLMVYRTTRWMDPTNASSRPTLFLYGSPTEREDGSVIIRVIKSLEMYDPATGESFRWKDPKGWIHLEVGNGKRGGGGGGNAMAPSSSGFIYLTGESRDPASILDRSVMVLVNDRILALMPLDRCAMTAEMLRRGLGVPKTCGDVIRFSQA